MRAPRRAPGRRGRGRRAAGGAIRDGGTFDGHRTREGRHGGDARGCERDVAQHSTGLWRPARSLFYFTFQEHQQKCDAPAAHELATHSRAMLARIAVFRVGPLAAREAAQAGAAGGKVAGAGAQVARQAVSALGRTAQGTARRDAFLPQRRMLWAAGFDGRGAARPTVGSAPPHTDPLIFVEGAAAGPVARSGLFLQPDVLSWSALPDETPLLVDAGDGEGLAVVMAGEWIQEDAEGLIYEAMNRNNRKPKAANHGKRPCSRWRRRRKTYGINPDGSKK